jgi:hypothetical protein
MEEPKSPESVKSFPPVVEHRVHDSLLFEHNTSMQNLAGKRFG